MAIREDKLGQSWLFPPCINDFIPENHICNLIVTIIAGIDVTHFPQVDFENKSFS